MMLILDCEQLSEEWFRARAGNPGASSFDKIITTKGAPSKQAHMYMCELAAEAITGIKTESYTNEHMQRGIELEPEAIEFYEFTYGVTVERVGLCYKDEDRKFHVSPDGLVGEDGLLELKCPMSKTHVSYILDGKLPTKYFQQVQGQLYVTERDWCDFLSYYPGLRPFIVRVFPDKDFIKALAKQLDQFCYALAETIKELKQ